MKGRTANNPKRRIAPKGDVDEEEIERLLSSVIYVGSANHKRRPGDYHFHPATGPRDHKSLCDKQRELLVAEARSLLRLGIEVGMFSAFGAGAVPKFVWCVSAGGEVFEAKTHHGHERCYHGYQLGDDDDMKAIVLKE